MEQWALAKMLIYAAFHHVQKLRYSIFTGWNVRWGMEAYWYPDHWGYSNGHGWTVTHVGEMMSLWYEGECLPYILVDDESVLDVIASDVS